MEYFLKGSAPLIQLLVRCQYTKVLTKQFLQEFLNKNFLTANEKYAKEYTELDKNQKIQQKIEILFRKCD